ncbi:MAG: tetratricopeptide repeat protein [Spirochaetia bacterium]|nr:tetratricopeptide repeat protein [Spirochaetia bacterium]
MRKFIYFVLIFMTISPAFLLAQDEQEAFTESSPDYPSVDASRIFSDDDQSAAQGGDAYLNAMTDKSKEEIEQSAQAKQAGIEVKKVEPTPTPVSPNEQMFKAPEIKIAEQAKTREQIEADVELLYKEGRKYYDIEDYDGASEIWERIITNYPTAKNLYDIRYSLAQAYEYSRQYDMAILQYQKVLAEKPKAEISGEASYRLAGCYSKIDKNEYAIEIYRDLIQRSPNKKETIRAYFNLAAVYMKQEKFKRVEVIYKNIIKYYPNTQWEIQGRFQLASLYAQTNRYKSAVKEYKLIKFKFKDSEWAPRAAMHIGDTYKLAGDYKNAKEAYSRVIYEYYKYDIYVQQADERIKQLKNRKEIENKFYEY